MAQRNPARLTDDELFTDWRRWIERAYNEAIAQGWRHKMFRLMRGVYQQNAELQRSGGFFVQWAVDNYIAAAAMSLRRELDTQRGVENLYHLLREIRDRPTVMSRARFRATWDGHTDEYWNADRDFDDMPLVRHESNSDADHIDPAPVSDDLKRLKEFDDVLEHVQKNVAHRMPKRADADVPTLSEFHEAITGLQALLERYYLWLTHKTTVTFEPAPQFNMCSAFEFAWISDRERFDYKACE